MPDDKSHAATPLASAISELESELSAGVPSSLASPHAETVGERLKRIYPEHYVRIITEATRTNGTEHTARMLGYPSSMYAVALSAMFIWERSAEGGEFWKALAKREGS